MTSVRPLFVTHNNLKTQSFPPLRRLIRHGAALLLLAATLAVTVPAFAGDQQPADSKLFLTGFNLYQKRDYAGATAQFNELLKGFSDSPLRDMTLFWLSRTYYRCGNQHEAARLYSQLIKEYPDTPLKGMVDDVFLTLVSRYQRGDKLPTRAESAAVPAG